MDRQSLKALLECPVCFEVKRDTQIYQCANGHIICADCKSNVNIVNCHTCRGSYTSPPIRNLHIEKLIRESKFEFPCKFAKDGCTVVHVTTQLLIHEEECQFGRITCTYDNCTIFLNAKEFDKHVRECHIRCKHANEGCRFTGKIEAIDSHVKICQYRKVPCPQCNKAICFVDVITHIQNSHPRSHFQKFKPEHGICTENYRLRESYETDKSWVVNMHVFENHTFFHSFHRSDEGIYYAWMKVLGDQDLASKYMVEISASGNGAMFSKPCNVQPMDRMDEDIMKDWDCFQISEGNVRQVRAENLKEEQRQRGLFTKIQVTYRLGKK